MKNGKLRTILIIFFAAVFVVSGVWAGVVALQYRAARDLYDTAEEQFLSIDPALLQPMHSFVPAAPAETPSPTETSAPADKTDPAEKPALPQKPSAQQKEESTPAAPPAEKSSFPLHVNFEALNEINEDVTGWILVPGADISYPILQGRTNDTYLWTAYTGGYAKTGSIFSDYRGERDFSDKNTVIYGHNMKDGSMFAPLMNYKDAEWLSEHDFFYILTEEGARCYEVFAVVICDALDEIYTFDFENDAEFSAWLDRARSMALNTHGTAPTAESSVVTLSTCTNVTKRERLVVIGRFAGME